ncbi:MAG: hypothetical protein Q8N88_04330 [Nanoarchaeota archaeon]|nr:hypothetical protein [Nanoarchaeota archaeon]
MGSEIDSLLSPYKIMVMTQEQLDLKITKLKAEIDDTKFEIIWETSEEFKKFLRSYLKILKNQLENLI